MSRRIQHPHLVGAESERIPLAHLLVDAGGFGRLPARADDGARGLGLERQVATRVVVVVMGGQDMRQSPPFGRQRGGHRIRIGRIDRGHDALLGIADQHAEIVRQARKLVNLELGHEDNSGAFACFFGSLTHPNSARFEFNRLCTIGRDAAAGPTPAVLGNATRSSMQQDVADLRDFYNRPLGGVVRRLLTSRIRSRWRSVQGSQLMGLGFAAPYIGMFRGEAARLGALMPANQGALVWPASGSVHSVMVEEAMLPLADSSIDRLLGVHCLEVSERTEALLREIWRVLTPEGRLLLIVPNRRGIWARLDSTPFGHGTGVPSCCLCGGRAVGRYDDVRGHGCLTPA